MGVEEASLLSIPFGLPCEVLHVLAGHHATQRLSGMGITPGTVMVKLSQAPFNGPIQVSVRDTRLVLGGGLASKIIVRPKTT